MSQARAESYNSRTRENSAETQRGVKPRTSSGSGAEEEGYRKKDRDKSPDRYDWKDSPYAEKETVLTDWYLVYFFHLCPGVCLQKQNNRIVSYRFIRIM